MLTDQNFSGSLRVTKIDRELLRVPFAPRVREWNEILVGEWGLVELVRVHTNAEGCEGVGETLVRYTWENVSDEAVARVLGTNPVSHLGDDSLGAGLQMALFDAVGKALGVPMTDLLNLPRVKDALPIAWWNTKMPPDQLALEAQDAVSAGYRAHKFKARPFFDVYDQVQAISDVTPPDYLIDLDWNGMLRTPGEAYGVLSVLDEMEKIGLYESPIRQDDITGHRALKRKISKPLAEHFRHDLAPVWLRDDSLDAFVVFGEGAAGLIRQGTVATAFNKTFWLQVVGTGLTTAFALHLSAVLTHATWPLVTAMNTLESDLLVEPLAIAGGLMAVPEGPGLGVELDEAAVDRYRVDSDAPPAMDRRLLKFVIPDVGVRIYSDALQLWEDCRINRNVPVQPRGAHLVVWHDDGTDEFSRCHEVAVRRPAWHE